MSLNFPKFEDNRVSTKTVIIVTMLTFNIQKLFTSLRVSDDLSVDGNILTLSLHKNLRGIIQNKRCRETKKINKKDIKHKYFSNSLTVVMAMDNKIINFKITRTGKFQITGCKNIDQAIRCVKFIWTQCIEITNREEQVYTFNEGLDYLKMMVIPAMSNIDFNLGFKIKRDVLSQYINNHTNYRSILETSIAYTGLNIKMPLDKPYDEQRIQCLEFKGGEWCKSFIHFNDYSSYLSHKERCKLFNKDRFNTFLVFQSGKVIMSGIDPEFKINSYYKFLDIIRESHNEIEDILV